MQAVSDWLLRLLRHPDVFTYVIRLDQFYHTDKRYRPWDISPILFVRQRNWFVRQCTLSEINSKKFFGSVEWSFGLQHFLPTMQNKTSSLMVVINIHMEVVSFKEITQDTFSCCEWSATVHFNNNNKTTKMITQTGERIHFSCNHQVCM